MPVDFFEKSNAFFHAVLEKVVIGSGQNVVRIRGRLVLEDLEQAMILLVKPVVHDFPFLAQLMSSCIDQRFVFELLVPTALDRVDGEQGAAKEFSAVVRKGRFGQEFPHARLVLVVYGIGPEGGVEMEAAAQLLEGFFVKSPSAPAFSRFLHAKGDLAQIEPVEVVVREEAQDVLVRSILGNPCPGTFVLAGEFPNHGKGKGLGSRHGSLGVRYLGRVEGEIPGFGKVEGVVEGTG